MAAAMRRVLSGGSAAVAAASLSLWASAPPPACTAAPAAARPSFAPCAEPACGSRSASGTAAADELVWPRMRGGAARRACPPDREELGRATWTLLHAVAAYFPEAPTAGERAAAAGLIAALATLYPCAHCRAGLAADVAAQPPRTASRAELAAWVCEQHNRVNAELGKPQLPCDLASLDARWRTGSPGCWRDADATAEVSLGRAPADDEAAEREDEAEEAAGP